MVVASDKSTLMAQFKVGTKGLADIDRKINSDPNIPVNYIYGYDFVTMLREGNVDCVNPSVSKITGRNLDILIKHGNTKPFFVFIRNNDLLYRAQIIQSLRNFCRKFIVFEEHTTLAGSEISKKDSLFKLLVEIYPSFLPRIYSDIHYTRYTFDEAMIFIQYIERHRPDIFDNLFILDLDNYSKTKQSIDLLHDYKVLDKNYYKDKSYQHSTRTLFMPDVLLPERTDNIYKVPYNKNKEAIQLIKTLYSDKFYTYERLLEYGESTI